MIVALGMLVAMLVLVLGGMPVAGGIGIVGFVSLAIKDPRFLSGVGAVLWNISSSFVLTAAPLFILMGEIVMRSGLSERFYRGVSLWISWLPGGLLHSNIGACALFAAASGSSVATAATIGTVAIPLQRQRYDKKLLYGSLAAGGTLGILIPPSIPMIIYASMVEESLGRLFMGGFIPGIMMACLFMTYIFVRCRLKPSLAPGGVGVVSWKDRFLALRDISPMAAIIAVVMGGIYLGWATPTEVAAIAVLMALLTSIAYRSCNWETLRESTLRAVRLTGAIVFIIMGAMIFNYSLLVWGATRELVAAVAALPLPPVGIFAVLCAFYLVLGCAIEATSLLVLTVAVVHPIITGLGFDGVWFGVVLMLLLETSVLTPPVGMNLYVIQAVAKEPSIRDVALGALPFVVLLIIGVILMTAFPDIVMFLPDRVI